LVQVGRANFFRVLDEPFLCDGGMDRCNAVEAHLIIFDRREDRTWDEKVFRREEIFEGHPIVVWGM